MSKNQAYAEKHAEFAMLCYFQHNMANVEYNFMYSLLFIYLVFNKLIIFYVT